MRLTSAAILKHLLVITACDNAIGMKLDEYLNGDLKHRIRSAAPARTRQQLKHTVVGHMRKLQKQPERVKSYFRHPDIAYAA